MGKLVNKMYADWAGLSHIVLRFAFQVAVNKESSTDDFKK